MGVLRVLLAASVLFSHIPSLGINLVPSNAAVASFFVISGFYMSLVLSEKYIGWHRVLSFYSNRYLRLYPAYFVTMLLASLLTPGLIGSFIERVQTLDFASKILVSIPNLTLFGGDLLFQFHRGPITGWHFTLGQAFSVPDDPTVRMGVYLANSPIWSIGAELWFYAIAPFVVRLTTPILAMLTAASLILRNWMEFRHPWSSYFFFPTNFWFFGVGMLAHRFWNSRMFGKLPSSMCKAMATVGVALLTARNFIPGFRNYDWMLYLVVISVIPFLFQVTKNIRADRKIGNLSYPIYIVHMPIIAFCEVYFGQQFAVITLLATIVFAILIYYSIEEPVDRWRAKRAANVVVRALDPIPTIQ